MKKILLSLIITISLIAIILQGCIDQKELNGDNNSIFISAPIKTLVLNLSDLPEGIYKFMEIYNDTQQVDAFTDEDIMRLEQLTLDYRNETDDEYLLLEIRKIESVEGAKMVFDFQKNVFSEFISDIVPTEGIGDHSIMAR